MKFSVFGMGSGINSSYTPHFIHILLDVAGGFIWKTTSLSNMPEPLLICQAMIEVTLQKSSIHFSS